MMQEKIRNITTYNAIVGAVLRQYRERLGSEQQDISSALGITRSSYSRLETGQTALSLSQLCQLAPLFKIRPSTFVSQVEHASQNMALGGVDIRHERKPTVDGGLTNILMGAALAALVAQLLRS